MKLAKSMWKWGLGLAAITTGGFIIRKWGFSPKVKGPTYRVLQSIHGFQIREYDSYIVAETQEEGTFESSSNEGFRRLASYISGANQTSNSLQMTAPVSLQGEKIAMTAPVGQSKEGSLFKITFVMPAHFTMETLPKPTDEKITFRQIPAQKVAVKQFSGYWDESTVMEQTHALKQFLENNLLTPAQEPIFARYNPPMTPFFMRRNEILIPLAEVDTPK